MVYCNINSPDEENNTNFSNEVKRLKHKIAQVSQIRLRISHIFVTGGVMNENKFYICVYHKCCTMNHLFAIFDVV